MRLGPGLTALSLALLVGRGSCLHAFPALQSRHHLQQDGNNASAQLLQLATGTSSANLSFTRECTTIRDRKRFLKPLLVPRLKLAFCYVPKVACSQFKDLINHLNGFGNWSQGFGHDYLISVAKPLGVDLLNVTKENGWKFASFTRDPALRYLSAFASTCVSNDRGAFEHPFECCGRLSPNNLTQEEMVRRFEIRAHNDGNNGLIAGDGHWVQQVEILKQCGWHKFRPELLDYWGHLSGDVNSQVKEMLRMVNHTDNRTVDRLFPKNSIAGHVSPLKFPPETFFRNMTTLKFVMKLYEDDYALLPGVGCGFSNKYVNSSLVECPVGPMQFPRRQPPKARRRANGTNSTGKKAGQNRANRTNSTGKKAGQHRANGTNSTGKKAGPQHANATDGNSTGP